MKLAGRVSAAIEVLTEITTRNRPAAEALRDWGKAHRFAGSTDRHVIGTLVFDTLRHRNTAGAVLGRDDPRALILGTLASVWNLPVAEISAIAAEPYGPGVLSAEEIEKLGHAPDKDLPDHVRGDFPAWLEPRLAADFGVSLVDQMQALTHRAPIDLRVNTLKATRQDVLAALAKFGATATPFSPTGLRIPASGIEVRNVNVEAEPAHGLGKFEVQDEASQIAVALTGAAPGETVLDLCAGAGGKALGLAAMMKNQGTVIAYDRDKHRLRPIFERINRSGASIIEVVAADDPGKLERQEGYDLVVVDAPCTGSGTWRRKPDAKWRLSEKQLNIRLKEQADLLERATGYVKPGGRLAYFTCSVLRAENGQQLDAFLQAYPKFEIIPFTEQWRIALPGAPPASADGGTRMLQLTPHNHNTDGFFAAILRRR